MAHLILFVLTMLDGRRLLLTVLGCLGGAAVVLATASYAALPVRGGRISRILLFGAAASALFWCVFIGALKASFPKLGVDLPLPALAPALAASGVAACATEAIRAFSRRTVRTAMLMGSVFACGLSLTVFSGMAVLVRPFALAYDLRGVLAVVGVGATLAAFAFWEAGDRLHPRRTLLAIPLLAAALLVLSFGSLGSILPFDRWIEASARQTTWPARRSPSCWPPRPVWDCCWCCPPHCSMAWRRRGTGGRSSVCGTWPTAASRAS